MKEMLDLVQECFPTKKEKAKLVLGAIGGAILFYVGMVEMIIIFG